MRVPGPFFLTHTRVTFCRLHSHALSHFSLTHTRVKFCMLHSHALSHYILTGHKTYVSQIYLRACFSSSGLFLYCILYSENCYRIQMVVKAFILSTPSLVRDSMIIYSVYNMEKCAFSKRKKNKCDTELLSFLFTGYF